MLMIYIINGKGLEFRVWGLVWSYYNKETILITIDPYYGNLNEVDGLEFRFSMFPPTFQKTTGLQAYTIPERAVLGA